MTEPPAEAVHGNVVQPTRADILAAVEQVGADVAGLRTDATQSGDRIVAEMAQMRVDADVRETSAEERHTEVVALLGQILERLPKDEPPPPPPRGTVFGAAVWSYSTDWQPMLDALGVVDLECRRTYYTPDRPIPPTWDSVSAGGLYVDVKAGRGSLVTFRPPAGSVAAGKWDEQLTSLFASKPAGIPWYVGLGNEDERTGIDPADRAADTIHLADLRDASTNAAEIKVTRVHMGYSFDVGWDVDLWLPPAVLERLDFLTINHYQTLKASRRRWRDIMAPTMAWATAHDVDVGLGEWGYPDDAPDNPTLKPSIVDEVGEWCDEYEVPVACHYNTDQGFVSNDPRYLQDSSELTLMAFREMFAAA